MRRISNAEGIKEVIDRLLKAYRLESKFHEAGLISNWEKVLGTAIANRTEKLYINNRKLFVKLNSPALKQELSMSKSRLVTLLNEQNGGNIIEEVVFI